LTPDSFAIGPASINCGGLPIVGWIILIVTGGRMWPVWPPNTFPNRPRQWNKSFWKRSWKNPCPSSNAVVASSGKQKNVRHRLELKFCKSRKSIIHVIKHT